MTFRYRGRNFRAAHFIVLFLVVFALVPHVFAESATYWIQASKSLGNAGRWNESLDAAEKAIAIDPGIKTAWTGKATALKNLNRYQESHDAAQKAISLDPDFINAWLIDCSALNSLGKYQDALAASEKALSLDPNNYVGWDNKAVSLYHLNRYQESLDASEKSIELNSAYAKSWANKGNALQNLGRYKEALAAYDKSLSLDPNFEPAINSRQIILSYLLQNSTPTSITSLPVATSIPPAPTPPSPIPLSYLLPLVIVILIITAGGGLYAFVKYKQKRPVPIPSPQATASAVPFAQSHHDVFISFAQVDKPVADAACAKLESRNIRCWIAPRDVSPGKNFPEAIVEGIAGSRIMVLIFSSHSNKSQHVIRELTTALKKELIIIPFRIENVEPTKSMEYLIGIPHWLDAINPPLERHLEVLVSTIEKFLSDNTPETSDEK